MRAKPPLGFKNVDLEIVSRSKLNAIETALSSTAHALYSGPLRKGVFLLSLECNVYPKNADAAIVSLCDAVDRLGRVERSMWDRALRRTFDVGYGVLRGKAAAHVALKPATLERIVALGGTVAFTCYPDEDGKPNGATNRRLSIHSETNSTPQTAGSRR